MNPGQTNAGALKAFRSFTRFGSLISVVIGILVIAGWAFDISILRSLIADLPGVRFNTGLCILLLGGSLWFLQEDESGLAKKRTGRALAWAAFLISVLTISQYLFRSNLGIDELFFQDLESPSDQLPGRISPIGVLCTWFCSMALLMLGSRISQYLSLSAILLSFAGVLNFVFEFQVITSDISNTYLPVQTSASLLILSLALITARPTAEIMKLLSSDLPGSRGMRLLLPGIVFITILLAFLVEEAEQIGALDPTKESVLLVILLICIFSPLVYMTSVKINEAEEELNRSVANLAGLIESTDDQMWSVDRGYRLITGNAAFLQHTKQVLGRELRPGESILQKTIPPDLRDTWQEYFDRALAGEYFSVEIPTELVNPPAIRELHFNPIVGTNGRALGVAVSSRDITARRQAEESIRKSEQVLRAAESLGHTGSWEQNLLTGEIFNTEENLRLFFGNDYSKGNGFENFAEAVHPDDREYVMQRRMQMLTERGPSEIEYRVVWPDGSVHVIFGRATVIYDESGKAVRVYGTNIDITERKQAEAETLRHLSELQALYENGLAISRLLNPREIGAQIIETFARYLSWHHVTIRLRKEQSDELELIAFNVSGFRKEEKVEMERKFNSIIRVGQGLSGSVVESGVPVRTGNLQENLQFVKIYEGMQSGLYMPLKSGTRVIGVISVESQAANAFSEQDERLLATLANQAAVAVENARLYQSIQEELAERKRTEKSLLEFRRLMDESNDAIYLIDPETGHYIDFNRNAYEILGYTPEELLQVGVMNVAQHIPTIEVWKQRLELISASDGLIFETIYRRKDGLLFPVEVSAKMLEYAGRTIMLGVVRDISERKQSETRIEQQLARLTALREIDRAIVSTTDVRLSLGVLLSQTLALLGIDAADILLLNRILTVLEYSAGIGFRTAEAERRDVRVGDGLAGRAALTRNTVHMRDLSREKLDPPFLSLVQAEGFVEYVGVPLLAKGKLLGVLETFQRSPVSRDAEWLDILELLAGQAALAIDNAQTFDGLQRTNMELMMAYDSTIAGWSRAMDLRDRETEGHTQRVSELTLKLAQRLGISNEEQIQIRRGALLHDIGKLGVPDSILLKPGKLTDEEWEIMKRHTEYAHAMLASVVYLRPAIDIPYCHHEKWDGTGYPRGLQGEQIPLPARIFAVVDVWDALTSDRPYRAAWSKENTLEYIREGSGTHFDPRVVDAFLPLIDHGSLPAD